MRKTTVHGVNGARDPELNACPVSSYALASLHGSLHVLRLSLAVAYSYEFCLEQQLGEEETQVSISTLSLQSSKYQCENLLTNNFAPVSRVITVIDSVKNI